MAYESAALTVELRAPHRLVHCSIVPRFDCGHQQTPVRMRGLLTTGRNFTRFFRLCQSLTLSHFLLVEISHLSTGVHRSR